MAFICNKCLSRLHKHKLHDGTNSRLLNALACTPCVLHLLLERERSTNMRKPQQIPRHQNLSLPMRLTGPTAQHCSRTGSAFTVGGHLAVYLVLAWGGWEVVKEGWGRKDGSSPEAAAVHASCMGEFHVATQKRRAVTPRAMVPIVHILLHN
jgi:hypothetical protein